MKKILIPAVLSGLLLVGCSSAYRTAQTPDDVYYSSSPNMPVTASRSTDIAEYRNLQGGEAEDGEYRSYWDNADDNYLKMKVKNGGRWNAIDDYSYWNGFGYNNGFLYNPYMYNYSYSAFNTYNPWGFQRFGNYWGYSSWYNGFGYPYGYAALGYGYGSPYGYGYGYNNFYGGYYPPIVVGNKAPLRYNPSRSNLTGYSNNTYYNRSGRNSAITNNSQQQPRSLFRSVFSNQGTGTNAGGNIGNTNTTTIDRPARTFNTTTPSSSGSSSSGGTRSTGGGGASRGGRGG
jgi:hypothetical protein